MKTIHKVSIWIILILSVGHTLVATPAVYAPEFTAEALWFAGAGLGWIFLSFFNIVIIQTPNSTGLTLCILANALASIYCFLVIFWVPTWQPIVLGFAFAGALAGCISLWRATK